MLMPPEQARTILLACGCRLCPDFHVLTSTQVDALLVFAKAHRYRRPRNANGSTGRCWYAYLCRRAARDA